MASVQYLCLWCDMSDDEPMAAPAEPAVRHQRHIGTQARSHQRTGRGQHLRHAGSALRPLVADHHHHACSAESIVWLDVRTSTGTMDCIPADCSYLSVSPCELGWPPSLPPSQKPSLARRTAIPPYR